MSLKVAQTFYVDKTVVNSADTITLDRVDLYFKSKPMSTANRSGILNPGVTVFLMKVSSDGTPDPSKILDGSSARREYGEIIASSDASITTSFNFPTPVVVNTNTTYGIGISFDGSEEFVLWECKAGETLVGTNKVTSGATAKNVGKYFEYTSSSNWNALASTELKFSVLAYTYGDANTSANTVTDTFVLPSDPIEYILFDRYHPNTKNYTAGMIGEIVFQETPVIYGTLTVNSASTTIKANSNNINFSTLFPPAIAGSGSALSTNPSQAIPRYIVLRNGSNQSANVDVVEIYSVTSNTQIELSRLPIFSSTTATFSITSVGTLDHRELFYYTGRWFDYTANTFSYKNNFKSDILRLNGSNANGAIRFVNNIVESITISSGGTGYSNSDVVKVYPALDSNTADPTNIAYIPSYANAVANVVTNGSGTITGIAISNSGFGFTSNIHYSITTSAGTGAALAPAAGATIRSTQSNAVYSNIIVSDIPIHRTYPTVNLSTNQNHVVSVVQHLPYYIVSGSEHLLVQADSPYKISATNPKNASILDVASNDGRVYVLPSKSNLSKMSSNVTLTLANNSSLQTQLKSSSVVEVAYSSNNQFTVPVVQTAQVYNYSYDINNTITGERKGNGQGKAMCRHISEKVTLTQDQNAEDLIVYCDVYKPAGTNLYAFARLHNSTDQEAFDDKDWTQLEITSNNASITSSLTDETDIIELTYGIPISPASVNTITGDATLTLNSSDVVGVGTTWGTDLQPNDVIKIYSSLFSDDYMISVVRTVSNNTMITIDDTVTNDDFTGSTVKIDLIGRPSDGTNPEIGSPFQAFGYVPNYGITRYYDSAMGPKDTFNTFQIKLVLTSNNNSIVPKVHGTRAVGVSA